MEIYLPITYLNDFIFCPYSIYLHQIFEEGKDETFSAMPQQKGRTAHLNIDKPNAKSVGLRGIYVISHKLRVYGKIDTYYPKTHCLVEYKRNINTFYKGYYYQIWAQYFALIEMGYSVQQLRLSALKSGKKQEIAIPAAKEFNELFYHIRAIAQFEPFTFTQSNTNKCKHCIYSALCDKTEEDHVYS